MPVADALGRVTAEPVWATRSSPSSDLAAMDGIAVRAEETHGATPTTPLDLPPDQYVVVDTGDPIPDGFDAVVMREHVHYEGEAAEIMAAVPPYQHVRSIGEDVSAGELLLPQGHRLRPVDIAAAAAAGATDVVVHRRPRVAVIPTGDEIVPVGSAPEHGEILDTNSMMLVAQAREAGCEAWSTGIEPDDADRIGAAVRAAAAGGRPGHRGGRLERRARRLHRPGGRRARRAGGARGGGPARPPVVLGVVDATPVVGCPGYPVSAALTFEIFAAPLLARLEGVSPAQRATVSTRLARKLPSVVGMDDWVRVRLGSVRGEVVASPLPRGAGVLTSLVRADGLLRVPAGVEGSPRG